MITRSDLRHATLAIMSGILSSTLFLSVWISRDDVVRITLVIPALILFGMSLVFVNGIGEHKAEVVTQESEIELDEDEKADATWFTSVMNLQHEIEMAARTYNVSRLSRIADDLKQLVKEEQDR